jgi:hypothetical protein
VDLVYDEDFMTPEEGGIGHGVPEAPDIIYSGIGGRVNFYNIKRLFLVYRLAVSTLGATSSPGAVLTV